MKLQTHQFWLVSADQPIPAELVGHQNQKLSLKRYASSISTMTKSISEGLSSWSFTELKEGSFAGRKSSQCSWSDQAQHYGPYVSIYEEGERRHVQISMQVGPAA